MPSAESELIFGVDINMATSTEQNLEDAVIQPRLELSFNGDFISERLEDLCDGMREFKVQFYVRNRYPRLRQNVVTIPLLLCLFVCLLVSFIVYSEPTQLQKMV